VRAVTFTGFTAVERGASVLCGGAPLDGPGFLFAATVLADVSASRGHAVMREEPFGAIATINRFCDLDDAIAQANATEYAFAAYLFTDCLDARRRVLPGVRASNLGINPMAPSVRDAALGGMQASGVGYEGGRDGIAAFQHLRLVSETG
jgi:succinate-semialdehyde dehydrogenase / glutarate-semialdehyde dehydrogenase